MPPDKSDPDPFSTPIMIISTTKAKPFKIPKTNYSVPPDIPNRYSILSIKYTDKYNKGPTDCPSQSPIFATSSSKRIEDYIQHTNRTEVPSPPPSSPPHLDLRNILSSVKTNLLIHLPP